MNNLTLCCIPVAKEYMSKELTRYKRQKTCADLVHFFDSTKKKASDLPCKHNYPSDLPPLRKNSKSAH